MSESQAEIVISSEGKVVNRRTLAPGSYRMGRGSSCEIRLEDASVSSQHAVLTVNETTCVIEDLGSANGTYIESHRVKQPTTIQAGDRIEMGGLQIEIRLTTALTKSAADFLRGPKYEIGATIARGGMGSILNAREKTTGRAVAMKVMLNQENPDELAHFIDEAQITAQLEHPNIVPVHELGVDEQNHVFFTMKLVKGDTLHSILEKLEKGDSETLATYPLPALLNIFQKVCDGIAFAHSKRVVHRDLKPDNIMVGDFGEVLVMDWGLAKVLTAKDDAGTADAARREAFKRAAAIISKSLGDKAAAPSAAPKVQDDPLRSAVRLIRAEEVLTTQVGMIFGTPQYMAPEQARGEVDKHDERVDVYALGAILYHILTLRTSVSGDDPWKVMSRAGKGDIDPIDTKKKYPHIPGGIIPEAMVAIVKKAMQFESEKRYAKVRELQADIGAYQNGCATSAEDGGGGKQFGFFSKRGAGR